MSPALIPCSNLFMLEVVINHLGAGTGRLKVFWEFYVWRLCATQGMLAYDGFRERKIKFCDPALYKAAHEAEKPKQPQLPFDNVSPPTDACSYLLDLRSRRKPIQDNQHESIYSRPDIRLSWCPSLLWKHRFSLPLTHQIVYPASPNI